MACRVYWLLLLSLALGACSSVIEECIRDTGAEYRGEEQKSFRGSLCLNWNGTNRDYDTFVYSDLTTGVGDHNYCRNPDESEVPWCYVSRANGQPEREDCNIESCQDGEEEETAATADQEKSGGSLQPVVGVSQPVKTGPKKKKDLGTTGYVLAIMMMAIIIILGVGITVGYFYKRGLDLKKQHDQRVYEREMHRITLPLSAFANPTCELVDENTIVVAPEPAVQAPEQGVVEGSDPLIESAGTPGA